MSDAVLQSNRLRRTALLGAGLVVAMIGLSFAAVPAYRIFCQVTGYDGTPQRASVASLPGEAQLRALAGKTVQVRFDGNVQSDLPWSFKPAQGPMDVKIGEQNIAYFTATSHAGVPTTGSATFNVAPQATGLYFAKIQCFCFTEQTLQPGETVEMPVVFYVDPGILDDVDTKDTHEITLSYTFYPVKSPKEPPGIRANGNADIAALSR